MSKQTHKDQGGFHHENIHSDAELIKKAQVKEALEEERWNEKNAHHNKGEF